MSDRTPSQKKALLRSIKKVRSKAKPCPFCGSSPDISPWHGGGPYKTAVSCEGDVATSWCPTFPSCTAESPESAVERWNARAAPEESEEE